MPTFHSLTMARLGLYFSACLVNVLLVLPFVFASPALNHNNADLVGRSAKRISVFKSDHSSSFSVSSDEEQLASTAGSSIGDGLKKASPPVIHIFNSTLNPDLGLSFVKDSGVCETTPGVGQMSGYIQVGKNMSMWFWFFEARNNPDTAPFTLWLNGGPGCSSMIGLFQENGPCQVMPDQKTTVLNPFSWNNISNMIYIDQPIGTGFSFGDDEVNSTFTASPFVWNAFQVLFESPQFKKFKQREFIFATESYGGHYGPEFVTYFDAQNALIDARSLKGEKITVSALMINNGWYDPLLQNKAYVDFATNAPSFGPLQSPDVLAQLNMSFFQPGGCQDQELACYAAVALANTDPVTKAPLDPATPTPIDSAHADDICKKADRFCVDNVFVPAVGDRDSDDLRQLGNTTTPFPPEDYIKFLRRAEVVTAIGAVGTYRECANAPFALFSKTGDDARTLLPQLSKLADSNLRILLWHGDADINCNWLGGHASALALEWHGASKLSKLDFKNLTVAGEVVAAVKEVDEFAFMRVFGAGHEIPAFKPQAAFEIFKQIVNGDKLHSV
ncbi:alpha/beta-hydrolase [Panaeolus papilionaceus]|nr:alpha/beta-hydrolase [Panaeolus papilionaceus]